MDTVKTLDFINKNFIKDTLMETLSIRFTAVGEDFLEAKMPVTSRVHQPMGLLHGGATAALAESVGSAASYLLIDSDKFIVKGIEITANHLKSVREGEVTALAKPIHRGKTINLWEIRVTNEVNELVSICKLTTILLPKK